MFVGNKCWFRIDSSFIGFIFFYIGFAFKKFFLKINNLSTVWKISIILFCLVILFLIAQWNIDYENATGGMSINMCRAGKYPFLFIISGLVGTIMTMSISSIFGNCVKSKSILVFVSNGTIVILGFHMMVYMFVINPLFGINNDPVTVLVMSLLTLIICLIIVMLSNKFFPILLGNRK